MIDRVDWNRMIDRVDGWPAIRLTVPNNARTYAMALEAFTPSFVTDLQAYLDRRAGKKSIRRHSCPGK